MMDPMGDARRYRSLIPPQNKLGEWDEFPTRVFVEDGPDTFELQPVKGANEFAWGYTGHGPRSLAGSLLLDLMANVEGFADDLDPDVRPADRPEFLRILHGFVAYRDWYVPWRMPADKLVKVATGRALACSRCGRLFQLSPDKPADRVVRCRGCGMRNLNCEARQPRDGYQTHGRARRADGRPLDAPRKAVPER
jgi:DNA-directed RNA polymerase subunit RPC12/RpoP